MKVLLVEDENKLAVAVKYLFKENKIDCDIAGDGRLGYEMAVDGDYNVIILDIMLPSMDGFEILTMLRKRKISTPIIMLTAKDLVADKIQGLNLGADDYLTKPFDTDELIARVNALSRRSGFVVMNELTFADAKLNTSSGELSCGEETIKLNFKEKEILKLFFVSPKSILTKELLLDKVWGIDSDAIDNNLEAYISFLRKKLKFLNSKITIKNYQKFGYKLEVADDKEA